MIRSALGHAGNPLSEITEIHFTIYDSSNKSQRLKLSMCGSQ